MQTFKYTIICLAVLLAAVVANKEKCWKDKCIGEEKPVMEQVAPGGVFSGAEIKKVVSDCTAKEENKEKLNEFAEKCDGKKVEDYEKELKPEAEKLPCCIFPKHWKKEDKKE